MIKNKNYYIAFVYILFFVISIYFYSDLTIEDLKNNKLLISNYIQNQYIFSVLLFFIACTIFINSPLPFAALIKIMGGFFFGFEIGAIYNVTATCFACLIGFWLSRYAFRELFESLFYQKLEAVETEIETNGFYYFLSLRVVMVVPCFLINILAGISKISFKKYLSSTFLGVIPPSLIYANGGNKLEQLNNISDLFHIDIIISIVLLACVSLLPAIKKFVLIRL